MTHAQRTEQNAMIAEGWTYDQVRYFMARNIRAYRRTLKRYWREEKERKAVEKA